MVIHTCTPQGKSRFHLFEYVKILLNAIGEDWGNCLQGWCLKVCKACSCPAIMMERMSKTIFKTIMMWHSWHTSVLFLDVCRIMIFVT